MYILQEALGKHSSNSGTRRKLDRSVEIDGRFSKSVEIDGRFSRSVEIDGWFSGSVGIDRRFSGSVGIDGRFSRSVEIDGRFSTSVEIDGRFSGSVEIDKRLSTVAGFFYLLLSFKCLFSGNGNVAVRSDQLLVPWNDEGLLRRVWRGCFDSIEISGAGFGREDYKVEVGRVDGSSCSGSHPP